MAPPKKPPRFHDVQAGDWLMKRCRWTSYGQSGDEKHEAYQLHRVTDLWDDPVRGQHDPEQGRTVAVAAFVGVLQTTGEIRLGNKWPHTRRGLVSNGFRYATLQEGFERIADLQAKWRVFQDDKVVLIGQEREKRAGPKKPRG